MSHYFCKYCDRTHTFAEFKGYLCPDYVYYSCKDDLVQFGRFFQPGDYVKKFASPEFHSIVGDRMISAEQGLYLALIAWRGGAKSMLAKTAILNHLGYRKREGREYVTWLCEIEDQAVDHIKYIQRHLETNPAFRYYFGDYYSKGDWTKRGFETGRGDLFKPLGMTQKPRGRSQFVDWEEGALRLTKLILDDFESEANTKTKERRAYNKAFISGALMPTVDRTPGMEGSVWLLGTLVGHDTYLADLLKEYKDLTPEQKEDFWEVFLYPATLDGTLTDDSIPTWPDAFPLRELRKIKRRDFFLSPNQFWIEYMQDLENPEDTTVALTNIQYHNYEFRAVGKQAFLCDDKWAIPVYIYIGVDLAGIGVSKKHDYHAISVVAVDKDRNRYVLEIFNEHMPIFDVLPVLMRLSEKYVPLKRVNIEKAASGEMMRQIASQESYKSLSLLPGVFEGLPTNPQYNKSDSLIDCFGPLLRDKQLYIRREHDIVMDQLRGLPSPPHDDAIDSIKFADYYAGRLFPKSERIPVENIGKTKKKKTRKRTWRDSVWRGRDWREPIGA